MTWEKPGILALMDQKVKEENRDQKEMWDCSDLKVRKVREASKVTQENRVRKEQMENKVIEVCKAEMERKVCQGPKVKVGQKEKRDHLA